MPQIVNTPAAIYKEVTLSLDTSAYVSGDVLAATQEIAGICEGGRPVLLWSLVLLDKDDQGQALTLYFLRSNASIGTENAAASITDTVADEILTKIVVASGDYADLGANRIVLKSAKDDGMAMLLMPDSGQSIYIAAVSDGTGTYTAAGITLKIGFQPV